VILAAGTLAVLSLLHATPASPHAQQNDTGTGGVPVAVVIEFGPRSRIRPSVVVKCLKVRPGSSGADVLTEVASLEQLPAPTYAPSGLLCSIDGYPTNGCDDESGANYAYWSYWHGGSTWSYANVGPAEFTVTAGDVEGWRWQPGGNGSSADPAPSLTSRFASVCDRAAVVPTGTMRTVVGESTPWVALVVGAIAIVAMAVAAMRWRRSPR
jgi:hypothetical protein